MIQLKKAIPVFLVALIHDWKPRQVWRGLISAGLIVTAGFVVLVASCSRHESTNQVTILENQTRMLMVIEAEDGFKGLFNTTFDPAKARLLLGSDLQKWSQEHEKAMQKVPEPIKESIKRNEGAALLIEGGRPTKGGGRQDVVYMRPSRFGINRFFVFGNNDPCGDGNPATCENCTGCHGEIESGGTIHTCVCTESCDACNPCPNC
jgi:hypothetical protein